jgi:hypothetical protein
MLVRGSKTWIDTMFRATQWTGTDIANFLNSTVRLPAQAAGIPARYWADTYVWESGDFDAISRSVFERIGDRPPAIPLTMLEANSPTRSIFGTFDEPIRYEDINWPGRIPPLFFYSAVCEQRVVHCHVIMIFHFYVKSAALMCEKLRLNPIEAIPIKSSLLATFRYVKEQATQVLSWVINNRSALGYKSPRRLPTRISALQNEMTSCGSPYCIDGATPRAMPWRFPGVRHAYVSDDEVDFLPPAEHYYSRDVGRTDDLYKGQACIHVKPICNAAGMTVTLPTYATFVVLTR